MMLTGAAAAGVINPDFEQFDAAGQPIGWNLPPKYAVERGAGSNGSAGLVYTCTGGVRQYASQAVKLEPGRVYRFGAYVKAEDVKGTGIASMCLTWTGENGKWLGELRSAYITRGTDGKWLKLAGLTKPLGEDVRGGSIAFCPEDGLSGRFFIDKVFFEEVPSVPVTAVYTSAYRGEAWEGNVTLAAALSPVAFGCPASALKAVFTVTGPTGVAVRKAIPLADPRKATVTLPVADVALGTNDVVCALVKGTKTVGSARTTLVRTSGPTGRKVYVDSRGRTIVDGKPFFPYGMYVNKLMFEERWLKRYCEASFNVFVPYAWPDRATLDRTTAAGLRFVYNVSADVNAKGASTNWIAASVRNIRDHKGLLGWYVFDEQPSANADLLTERYRLVSGIDRDHPTWCAQDLYDESGYFLDATDIFGTDPYPVPDYPLSQVTAAMRTADAGLMGVRSVWQVVQAWSWSWTDAVRWPNKRRPSETELRNMTWQAIAGGARGIIYYIFSDYCRDEPLDGEKVTDIWEEIKRVSREVKAHERVLLFAETESVPGLPAGVVGRIFREHGESWELLVNTTDKSVAKPGLKPYEVSMKRLSEKVVVRGLSPGQMEKD